MTIQQSLINSGVYNAIIILVLLAIDKIVLIKHMRKMIQWLIYLIIGNLSYEIWRSWSRSGRIIVGLIFIHKRDFFEIKMEIYHQIIEIITKKILKSLFLYMVI